MSHMPSSFKKIDNFVYELFGVPLLTDQKIEEIAELENARKTMLDFLSGAISITSSSYLEYILPIIEVLLPWDKLKEKRIVMIIIDLLQIVSVELLLKNNLIFMALCLKLTLRQDAYYLVGM